MKLSFFYLSLLIALFSFISCKTSKNVFNPDTSETTFLTFGTGGGFTGKVTQYFLTKEGVLFLKNGDELSNIGKVPKQMTNQVFSNYEKLGLDLLNVKEPGNKYSFIERKSKDSNNAIMWGREPLENKNIETYFVILMNIVKKLSAAETL